VLGKIIQPVKIAVPKINDKCLSRKSVHSLMLVSTLDATGTIK